MTTLASRYRRQTEHAPRCAGTPFFFFLRQFHVAHNTRRAVISSPEGCFRQVLLSFVRCCWSFVGCRSQDLFNAELSPER